MRELITGLSPKKKRNLAFIFAEIAKKRSGY
jgi:hypothetical protein